MANTNGAGGDALPWNSRDWGLSCHVTTHRIVLIDERDAIAVVGGSILLAVVQSFEPAGGPSILSPFCSYKIDLNTHAWGKLTIVFRGGETGSYAESRQHRDDALAAIKIAMKREAWNKRERRAMNEAMRPSNQIEEVGLDAIQKRMKLIGEFASSARMSVSAMGKYLMLYFVFQDKKMHI